MNFVKWFYIREYGGNYCGYPNTCNAINEFAKENGVEPISLSDNNGYIMVVFQPIDFSGQVGSKN